ncbi:homoserine dehydrogenase [Halanaerobium congolense]|uniref:Homoserine dehydrogenase n=1 Tax=Halanaerobium congolense TaxID=54121 RepID=A0A1M7NX87_9FIRM|nr:homoserine dehydrogenase [Halanaerobium congolense]OEG63283.1 MAG: homoserine dehydrogenase [Halanaerobium sp. MDAL1]PUU93571.1 MAG: homoserine dehydrogenase [Halanaerobium sp.]PTX17265.1 homoserine dehydrogenase [Halanaerobium congolense]PXV66967.1 homoserine dehydrogenase [Halanaerobium congolense]TDP25645.1 homoserine dehydrogenase [Halanaerobium congolense]
MLRLGILGLGTVGSGVVKILEKNAENIKNKVGTEVKIKKILVNNLEKERDIEINRDLLTNKVEDIIDNPEIDIVVELIGGEQPAYDYIIRSIENGKSIVTANKLVIAKYGKRIFRKADENNVQVCYEGSVAGGLPIIRPLQNSLAANRIEKIYGILNGTTNYILTDMSKNQKDFDESLKNAQKLGFAEADPSSDIDGHDAAYKITILSSLAFERFVDVRDVYVEGIREIKSADLEIAHEMGYVIKLLAIAKNGLDGVDIRVHPAFVPEDHPISMINGTYNCVYLHGDAVGQVMSTARGAGQMPTGSAVTADIIQVAKDINHDQREVQRMESFLESNVTDIDEIENSFYLRFEVKDKPGVLSHITKIFGDNNVSLASVLQKQKNNPIVPLVFITHHVKEKNLKKSLAKIKELDDVIEINSVIRVEDDI